MSSRDQFFIQKTYELARQAALNGDHPFGALASLDDARSLSVAVRDSLSSVTFRVKIEGPLLEDEGEQIHMKFWNQVGGKKSERRSIHIR